MDEPTPPPKPRWFRRAIIAGSIVAVLGLVAIKAPPSPEVLKFLSDVIAGAID